ncbi:MAG: hypothetical protein ABI625_02375 [bacterium]
MKAFHIAALSTALVIASATGAGAQAAATPQQGAPEAARARGNAQLAGIELSEAQKTKLEAITVKYADQSKAAREAMATDPSDAMKRMMAVRDKMVPEVRAVLTTEQQAIFDKNVAEMKMRMGGMMMKPPAL